MGRKKYKTDTEIVDQALSAVEDPYNLRPLISNAPMNGTLEERFQYAVQVFRPEINRCHHRSVADFILAGRFIKASEELIDQHKGENKKYADFIDESGWSGNFVRVSKRLAEVVARYPEAIKLPSGTGLQRILYWSIDRIGEFLDEIGAENLKGLTHQRLLDVYREKEEETRRKKKEHELRLRGQKLRRHREKRVAQGLPADDPPPSAFDIAYSAVVVALKRLAIVYITDAEQQDILHRELASALGEEYSAVFKNPRWPTPREISFELAANRRGHFQ